MPAPASTPVSMPAVPAPELRSDISRLKTGLEFFNIALIPIIVAAAAIVLGALRLRRRRRRTADA